MWNRNLHPHYRGGLSLFHRKISSFDVTRLFLPKGTNPPLGGVSSHSQPYPDKSRGITYHVKIVLVSLEFFIRVLGSILTGGRIRIYCPKFGHEQCKEMKMKINYITLSCSCSLLCLIIILHFIFYIFIIYRFHRLYLHSKLPPMSEWHFPP